MAYSIIKKSLQTECPKLVSLRKKKDSSFLDRESLKEILRPTITLKTPHQAISMPNARSSFSYELLYDDFLMVLPFHSNNCVMV